MKKYLHLCAFGVLLGAASCSKDSGKSGPLARPISVEQLRTQLITLSDTLSGKWTVMAASDSTKIEDMEEMLAALPPAVLPPDQRADLQKSIKRLSTLRYDRKTMSNSDMIDAYDMAHDSVYKALFAFLPDSGSTGIPRVDSLKNEIQAHHNEVVMYRSRYDVTAKEMNTLIRRYRKRLPRLGKPYDTLQPAPLFQWVDNSKPNTETPEEE
ncbi:hypothetical protein GU926_05935 [Nibribacter ruber]|uniref:Lipoprotein n=1 Tax=Nibribacter ruber TaxID=2698458 RepID=A0A6P1NXQ6_9BACT|nr:hypothetical protein [Nibribacter ruber]QHL86999.1 hypothetical protein GU926_05935 [Nibribacter ruber]